MPVLIIHTRPNNPNRWNYRHIMVKTIAITVGRRKSAVARVHVASGKGVITINKKSAEEYFGETSQKEAMLAPLQAVDVIGQYDITVNVKGGGITGQSGAISLGIARALEKINEDYRGILKKAGLLTRDSREVERKKYGQPGARKKFQFSKR